MSSHRVALISAALLLVQPLTALGQQESFEQWTAEAERIGRLARAVTRTASRLGGDGISREVSELSSAVYCVNAITGDREPHDPSAVWRGERR